MFDMKRVTFLCLSLYILGTNAGLVPFIKPCHWSDNKCILKSAKEALPTIAAGIPELGMECLDPLAIKEVDGDSGELKLKFNDMVIKKLSQCDLINVERPERNKLVLSAYCPITVTGNYVLDGKLLFLNISGHGPFEIKTDKVKFDITSYLEDFKKDGKDYYKCTKYDYNYDPVEKFYFKFDNLFNGDQIQAKPVSDLLDESWRDIITVFGKPIVKSIIGHIVKPVNKLFSKVPHEELELS